MEEIPPGTERRSQPRLAAVHQWPYWVIFGPLLIICLYYPVRYLPVWSVNPVAYGLLALICLLTTIRFARRYSWNQWIVFVMLACALLAVLNGIVSFTEIGRCWLEDVRYTQVIACDSHTLYTQIESLPVGMQNYCYYCPWY